MNSLVGIWLFGREPLSKRRLSNSLFCSPAWKPDHCGEFFSEKFGCVSTQRFITPECASAPMPLTDPRTGCVIVGDLFLTHRTELINLLRSDEKLSDAELILQAYDKWRERCVEFLFGNFMFAIWNPKAESIFIATDHHGYHPCLYSYEPGKHFVFSNTIYSFRTLLPNLTPNPSMPVHFALDSALAEDSCYTEVKKLPAAHTMTVTMNGVTTRRYWKLRRKSPRSLECTSREEYLEKFSSLFRNTVNEYLRVKSPISAQISGGLDSTSVAAMAAKLLNERKLQLFGFTSLPLRLEGESYRKNWVFEDKARVLSILRKYPNIQHQFYTSSPLTDPYEILNRFKSVLEQPFRNVSNLDWFTASYEYAESVGSKALLTGQMGNGGISWAGRSIPEYIENAINTAKIWISPNQLFNGYFRFHNQGFLKSPLAKDILRKRGGYLDTQRAMLSGTLASPRHTNHRSFSLWYGVECLDPTSDIKLAEFCFQIPQWVFFRGENILERRLLVREGLKDLLPEEVCKNPFRGEQSPDWYLKFNNHSAKWRKSLEELSVQDPLWELYDRDKILGLFTPVTAPSNEATRDINSNLMRCIALANFTRTKMQEVAHPAELSSATN